jgi:hypothetical protein
MVMKTLSTLVMVPDTKDKFKEKQTVKVKAQKRLTNEMEIIYNSLWRWTEAMEDNANILDGFRTYYMASGAPSITFTKNGLGVSKAAVAKLDNSPYVKILFDYDGKRMAIVKCLKNESGSAKFYREQKDGARWNSADLSKTIKRITQWSINSGERYTINGDYVEYDGQPTLIFDFDKATITLTKS